GGNAVRNGCMTESSRPGEHQHIEGFVFRWPRQRRNLDVAITDLRAFNLQPDPALIERGALMGEESLSRIHQNAIEVVLAALPAHDELHLVPAIRLNHLRSLHAARDKLSKLTVLLEHMAICLGVLVCRHTNIHVWPL